MQYYSLAVIRLFVLLRMWNLFKWLLNRLFASTIIQHYHDRFQWLPLETECDLKGEGRGFKMFLYVFYTFILRKYRIWKWILNRPLHLLELKYIIHVSFLTFRTFSLNIIPNYSMMCNKLKNSTFFLFSANSSKLT